ncbi:hypothetical protein PVL30_004026 [Lodderomyces elongisporus]|uniref:Uncharacterized protein n=1 Tax=Lodderomyces elongisporus (strain ATCC 11503 / CBS 2605 / JCM 1781 / NBRC 1676 / NRRL YB-4239) TaxID=379508 RepID=A5E3W4_LODEL|nr:uncharacterized protein PVL30_004026 [Lodderomyces elongisporus]EDK46122.1 hypothetical protein LELG_04302 [Lodderomyces elongisporus NRRL YB-4239]WLF80250.1 hypothetical protein PVL30_004026 [Lodderomyces elongisporus]
MFRFATPRIKPNFRLSSPIRSSRCLSNTPRVQFFGKSPSQEEQAQAILKVQKVISEHPELKQLTLEFKELLDKKGLLANGKPSMTQMMKILTDKDIIAHGTKLKKYLDDNKTGITKEEMATLTGAYMFQGKDI